MNRNTFEEKLSTEISPLTVFVFTTISILVLIILTIALITVTPLKEYIPGYGSRQHERKIILLQSQVDSLQQSIATYDVYRKNIQNLFVDENFDADTLAFHIKEPEKTKSSEFAFSKEDSMLMQIELQSKVDKQKGNIKIAKSKSSTYTPFFVPYMGSIESKFNLADNQYGITLTNNTENKLHAIASGNVLSIDKTTHFDDIIILQHPNNTVSVYKYKGTPIVETGDFIKESQIIAKVSPTSKQIYFELWIEGKPVNPENYILF